MQARSGVSVFALVAVAPQLWADVPAVSTFVNPVYEGADPWVTQHEGFYYYCRSEDDLAISVSKSDRLTDPGVKRVVWSCPRRGWNSAQLWAPELHHISGKWYIYYAASNGKNENHRAGVLEAVTNDPQGKYVDRGVLYTGDEIETGKNNRWAIDATPVMIGGRLYLIWSGWPDTRDVQYLYIARMETPWKVAGNRVRICENDTYLWERVDESQQQRGLHEAPQILRRDGWLHVVYSCSGSWEPSYKLGMLSIKEADDPLDPKNWKKHAKPVFSPTEQTFGVGHCSFVKSPDESEDWIVFHSKISRKQGWERAVYIQPFRWMAEGLPAFGKPVAAGEPLALPAGERHEVQAGEKFVDEFTSGNWDRWRYFGYSSYISVEDEMLNLGGHPRRRMGNVYRSGEKAFVRDQEWTDFSASVRVRFVQGGRRAGMLFRVREPAVGYDTHKGYFAGLVAATGKVVLGKSDGKNWMEIAVADAAFDPNDWHELKVLARGEEISVSVDDRPVLTARDSQYKTGMVGLGVVDTHAVFDGFRVDREETSEKR